MMTIRPFLAVVESVDARDAGRARTQTARISRVVRFVFGRRRILLCLMYVYRNADGALPPDRAYF